MIKAISLRTEYLKNPIGIDVASPRLSWNVEGAVRQTAYQIIASEDGKILWDSGKVRSSRMAGVPYAATVSQPLRSGQRLTWKVRLWDENDLPGDWSEEAFFEMGLLRAEDWRAKWITGDYRVNKRKRYPVDCFLKKFSTEAVKRARLYITACGLYEARINGEKVGDAVLTPGITDYRKRVQYQTYDVTDMLKDGENSITVELADGWYRGSTGAWGILNQYGTQTKLLTQLEIEEENGMKYIVSDECWNWSNDGPLWFADLQDGEVVDARLWPEYSGRAKVTSHPVVPTASNNVPVKEMETFKPVLFTTPSGKKILDFGQNIAGYVRFELHGNAGQRIFLRFGELIDADGEFTQKNIQCSMKNKTTPLQQVEYFCKNGKNRYKTKFAIFGFRYIEIETDLDFKPENFTAIAVYSAMEETITFDSSNELLNQFVAATRWSAKNNSADLPTDCPTRERHGWTGDAQIFCGTASYFFQYDSFGAKYIRDMYDWQKQNGCLPQIVPEGGVDFYMNSMNGSVGWADAGVFMPYILWKQYGDRKVLENHYDGMVRYASFMENRLGKWYPTAKRIDIADKYKKHICNCGQAYGEWAEPDDVHHMTWKDCAVPHPEVQTAYTARVMNRMAEIAAELGKTEDAKHFRDLEEKIKEAYQELVRCPGFELDTDRQACLVRPLAFGLLDEEQTAFAKKRLLQALENYGWRLGTGFLSTPLIMDVLAEIDIESAYKLLENEEIPGWLSMPKQGATTIWEAWEGPNTVNGGIGSLNHYSKGAVCQWIFSGMCGINMNGENHFRIAPKPGGKFTHARAVYQSVYGAVVSGWKKQEDGRYVYEITIPANTTARVVLPDGRESVYQTGYYVL